MQECKSIAIIFVGVGKYTIYFPNYYRSAKRLFLPRTKKTFFVFTDQANFSPLLENSDIVTIAVKLERWPLPALYKFKYISQNAFQLEKFSHIVFMDADMQVVSKVREEEFFCHDKLLFSVQHPSFLNKRGTFEFNRESLATVSEKDDLSVYRQGCLWGGKTKDVLDFAREMEKRIDDDLSRNIIAIWYDESHLNKYFIEHKDMVFTLGPEYAYPGVIHPPTTARRIMHFGKDTKSMRTA